MKNLVVEFYNEIKLDKYNENTKLCRVREAIAIWKMYLEINAPSNFLIDQQDIILQTLKIYCGQESTCEFNTENKVVIIKGGGPKIVLTI